MMERLRDMHVLRNGTLRWHLTYSEHTPGWSEVRDQFPERWPRRHRLPPPDEKHAARLRADKDSSLMGVAAHRQQYEARHGEAFLKDTIG